MLKRKEQVMSYVFKKKRQINGKDNRNSRSTVFLRYLSVSLGKRKDLGGAEIKFLIVLEY